MKRLSLGLLLLLAGAPAGAYEGFEGGLGAWTPTGLWHRVVDPNCFTPFEGSAAVYLGRDGSCDYADGRIKDDTLSSGPVVLSDPATAFISFWMLYQVESFQPVCYDNIRLERSDDGVNWALLRKLGPGSDPPGGGPGLGYASGGGLGGPALWEFVKVDLSAFVPGTLHLRFRFVSSGSQAGEPLCLGQPDADMDNFLGVALDQIRFGQAGPRLSLSKSVEPGFGAPGTELTYSLTVRNDDSVARTLAVWDTLPAGLNFVAAPAGSFGGGRVDWSLSGVAAGAAITLQLRVQADPGLSAPQDILNSADAESDAPGGVQRSPSALFKLRAPGLSLRHSAAPSSIVSGDFATYNLVVENYSPLTQTALALGVQLPIGLVQEGTWPALSGPSRWDLPDLGPGQVRSFSLWGRGFGEDGALLTVNGRLSQGGGLLAQAPASVLVRKPIEPTVQLKAVYPNPAPSDKPGLPQNVYVYYSTNIAMPMTLDVFTLAGEKVRSLEAPGMQGAQQVAWDLNNQWGRPVASGVYAFRLWSSLRVIPTPEAFGFIAVLR